MREREQNGWRSAKIEKRIINESHTTESYYCCSTGIGNRVEMEANCLTSLRSNFASPFLTHHRSFRNQVFFCSPPYSSKFLRATSSTSNNNSNSNNNSSSSVEDDINSNLPSVTPPDTVEIRFRRGARRRSRQQQQQNAIEGGSTKKASTPKDWESMTLAEKALELYIGEKGLLFWLNKFAYASIFIIIGGWILFRFVGPSIGLYQLDTPPLSPSSLFKDGS